MTYIVEMRKNSSDDGWTELERTDDRLKAQDYIHINLSLGWRKYRVRRETNESTSG